MSTTVEQVTMPSTDRLCEDCNEGVAIHYITDSDDKMWHLCEKCNDAVWDGVEEEDLRLLEEEEEEELGMCVCCQEKEAKIVFMHLTNGNFELCISCFEFADHERSYGQDFGVSSSEDDGEY